MARYAVAREVEQLLVGFGSAPGVQQSHVDTLRSIIAASPVLNRELAAAIRIGKVQRLAALPDEVNAAGTYDPAVRTINLPLQTLSPRQEAEATFVLGHEVQHAHNDASVDSALGSFLWNVHGVAETTHDYTGPIGLVMAAQREDEASANLAGWNALVSRLRGMSNRLTLSDLQETGRSRTADFLDVDDTTGAVRVRPGLMINEDLTFTATDSNVDAMAEYFVDKPGEVSRLGFDARSDYANYYAAGAIGTAAEIHRAHNAPDPDGHIPPMLINLDRLNLDRQQLERNGLRLGPNASEPPMPYLDLSTSPPTPGHFHHTIDTHESVPIRAAAGRMECGSQPVSPAQLAAISFSRPHKTMHEPRQGLKRRVVDPRSPSTRGAERP